MKILTYFGLIVLVYTVVGCLEEKYSVSADLISSDNQFGTNKEAAEYGINKDGLHLEFHSDGLDTNFIFFNGRINQKLWVGGFEKASKQKIFEWTENSKLDTTFRIHGGYGEYANFEITDFWGMYFYKLNNACSFLLRGYDKSADQVVTMDLYFFNNENLIKKYRTIPYPSNAYFQSIHPWFNGIIVTQSNAKRACYNMNGDSLFAVDSSITINDRIFAVNYEDAILYALNLSEKSVYFSRKNIKTNETLWTSSTVVLDNSQEPIKINNTSVSKVNNTWTYKIDYTRYSGEKKSVQVVLDIDTGDINN